MKVAVIIYGQTRNLHISVKSWKFIHQWDCDFYVSTWSHTKQISDRLVGLEFNQKIDESYIKKHLPNVKIDIIDENEIVQSNTHLKTNGDKSIFHMKNCLRMIFEQDKKYDFILLTRSDQYFLMNDDLSYHESLNKKNTIYTLEEIEKTNDEIKINDIYFWGIFDTIKSVIENMNYGNLGLHQSFAHTIIKLNLDVNYYNLPISNVTVRPNALELDEKDINFNNLVYKSGKW